MSHYDIRYDTSNRDAADAKAIEDVKDWLGDRFDDVIETLVANDGLTPK